MIDADSKAKATSYGFLSADRTKLVNIDRYKKTPFIKGVKLINLYDGIIAVSHYIFSLPL